ncbi:hypothetical protein DPMN_012465 [Dreissena polymorpha]|uniref:Uncharacterized protein n=1 Tax=Dreissena polymorpha TaxID=45954 RepID=A0A9D4N617_DREPO|nr:hypothetical protein DPMN_012465 [Dreissena polymorpha]
MPGHYRRRLRCNRGVAVALPGSDTGIAPVSAGGVTVYRGFAGTLPAFTWVSTGALPATTGALPGLRWDKP